MELNTVFQQSGEGYIINHPDIQNNNKITEARGSISQAGIWERQQIPVPFFPPLLFFS